MNKIHGVSPHILRQLDTIGVVGFSSPLQKCPHVSNTFKAIPGDWVDCKCSTLRLYHCSKYQGYVTRITLRSEIVDFLQSHVPGYTGVSCNTCDLNPNQTWEPLPIPPKELSNKTVGFVTGGSSVHWPCMGAIAIAAFEHRVGLAVADHGLKDHQRAELDRCGVSWITHERPGLEIADVKHPIVCDVKAWWKPWVCQASPFNRSVWVDSDAVVVGDTHELFESCGFGIATQGLWNIEENQLYAKLVDSIFGEDGVPHLQQVRKINTGILCWSSGDPIIQDWLHWCDKLIHDTTLIKLCNVRDQSGMLVTLVNRLINNDPLPVMLGDEYNTPANYLPAKESHKREPISLNPARMMRDTILKHRDAKIVHWLGLPKPWDTKVSHAK